MNILVIILMLLGSVCFVSADLILLWENLGG